MDQNEMDNLVQKVMRELEQAGLIKGSQPSTAQNSSSQLLPPPVPAKPLVSSPPAASAPSKTTPNMPAGSEKNVQPKDVVIDLPDPTTPEERSRPQVAHPIDPEGLETLMSTTTSRLGVGRAGPRFTTRSWLLFGADQAITQDTLLRDVDEKLLAELGLFSVQTCITGGKQEYLLRPDLGRKLSDDARRVITEKCTKNPKIQVCVGDGLSAQAIESNIRKILPVIQQGCQTAGLSMGTPFFIKYCRVGVMNDIGDLINPEVLMLLIGERPGLGRADSMSVYLGYHPQTGHTDADRDVICNIYDNGGTNPLEAGAFAVQFAQKMLRQQAAGVKLKMMEK